MSDFCPHCDDFSIDATRAKKIKKLSSKGNPEKRNLSQNQKINRLENTKHLDLIPKLPKPTTVDRMQFSA